MAGVAAPAVAAFSCADRDEAARLGSAAPVDRASVTWDKAPCRFCGTGCGVMVGVEQGRVVAVRGDEASPVNRGLLCVKGYHLPGLLYGADRLLYPQRRNADGSFTRISWDEALDLDRQRGSATRSKQHGPDAVAMYGSGQWTVFDGYAALKWVKGGLRSNNLEPNARLCMASAVSGFLTQFQSDEPMGCYQDLELADDFVLWGNNMAEMHPVLFSRILETKRQKPGTRIVDIATRRTPTTDYADLHVLFKPGTDLALANGILHLLVAEGRIQQAFIDENVVFRRGIEDVDGDRLRLLRRRRPNATPSRTRRAPSSLDELRTFLADYTPDRVSEITGVPVEQIRALAAIYGDLSRGTVSLWCMGVNQHVRGTWMNNLITDLHLITGKICRPGTNPLSLTGQPSACGTAREVGTSNNRLPADMVVTNPEHRAEAEHIWKLPAGTIPATPGLSRRRHVPRAEARRRQGAVDPDDQSVGDAAEPLALRAHAQRRPLHRRQRHLSDADDGHRRPDPAGRGLGRARRHVRQHRAAHAALEQDGRSAGRGPRGRVAGDPGGQAHGHGASLPLARRQLARADVRGVPIVRRSAHGKDLASYAQLHAAHAACSGRS